MNKKKLTLNELLPLYKEALDSGKVLELSPQGDSMLPFIVSKKDKVFLKKDNKYKRHDIVLYLRENDKLVLHRIIKCNKKNNTFVLSGDNDLYNERDVPFINILAKVIKIESSDGRVIITSKDTLYKLLFNLNLLKKGVKKVIHKLCKRK
ncbi:MAG: S24/S26 family peptidase [Bacilli bacterium]